MGPLFLTLDEVLELHSQQICYGSTNSIGTHPDLPACGLLSIRTRLVTHPGIDYP